MSLPNKNWSFLEWETSSPLSLHLGSRGCRSCRQRMTWWQLRPRGEGLDRLRPRKQWRLGMFLGRRVLEGLSCGIECNTQWATWALELIKVLEDEIWARPEKVGELFWALWAHSRPKKAQSSFFLHFFCFLISINLGYLQPLKWIKDPN